jgi:hypothetical protein
MYRVGLRRLATGNGVEFLVRKQYNFAVEMSITTGNASWPRYSTLAEAFLAFGRIDFAARLLWLFDDLCPCAITGRANSFDQDFTLFFHNGQSSKQNQKLNSFKNDSG